MEPWSIVGELNGEPFGLVLQHDADPQYAEYIAINLLATYNLLGTFLPTDSTNPKHGQYLFTYSIPPEPIKRLGTIWATSVDDAELRLNILASDGILIMPASG